LQRGDPGLFSHQVHRERQAHPPIVIGQLLGHDGVAEAEPGHAEALGERARNDHIGEFVQPLRQRVIRLVVGEVHVGFVQHEQAGVRQRLRQRFEFRHRRRVSGRVVGRGDEHERRLVVHQLEQVVPREREVGVHRGLAQLHAAQGGLRRIDAETGHEGDRVVHARLDANAEQQVDDFIGAVAHDDAGGRHTVMGGDGLHKAGVSGLRIAECQSDMRFQRMLDQRRGSERVFIAGELDDPFDTVLLADLVDGEPCRVGLEAPDQ